MAVVVAAVRKCPYQNSYFPSNDVVAVAVVPGENEVDRSDGDDVRIDNISIGPYSVHRDTWERTARVLTSVSFCLLTHKCVISSIRIGIRMDGESR